MDNQKVFIIIGLFLTGFLFWNDYQTSLQTSHQDNTQTGSFSTLPNTQTSNVSADIPTQLAQNNQAATPKIPSISNDNDVKNVDITTDLYTLSISQKGGTINQLWLNNYPISLNAKQPTVQLFNMRSDKKFLAQSGLISKQGLPTHHNDYQVKKNQYDLGNDNQLNVRFYWLNKKGVEVIKTYTFSRASYEVILSYEIINNSKETLYYASYAQLLRKALDEGNAFLPTYSGGAIYNDKEVYKKIDFGDFNTQEAIDSKGGWLAMVQHYFLAAWIPNQIQNQHYSAKELNNGDNLLSVVGTKQSLASGKHISITPVKLYVGPKLQSDIDKIQGLDKTVDYGILYIIAKPVEVVLHWVYSWILSWGWAIIVLTVLIKLLFYKLSETSYRSMAKMRKLAPKMQKLKELYGDDKQKISQKMMAMYKEEKVNPASGCLPIFVQMPVFIALYWVLLESVELRHVDFWWLADLSAKDPYFILPVLMGISMFIQQKLNPTPPDPMQAKIMMMLPFVFTIFFFWMPSGLVLYWVINNVLSIAQQWIINKRIAG